MADKVKICRLYKDILRESGKFHSYYYRNYFTRKTRSQFKEHINADGETSAKLVKKCEDTLAMLRRQTVICNIYHDKQLVIENVNESKSNG